METISKTFGMVLRVEVDPEDDDLLQRLVDPTYTTGGVHYIAARNSYRNIGSEGVRGLHLAVLKRHDITVPKGMTVDHINNQVGDNRRSNLQVLTQSQNARRKTSRFQRHELPAAPRSGLRLYPVEYEIVFDHDNADLMGRVSRDYLNGVTYRTTLSVIAGVHRSGISLTRRILARHGIIVPKGMEVDHINGDGGDNRIDNLRVVTHAENVRNRSKQVYPAALIA
jgi:hypothetical protein